LPFTARRNLRRASRAAAPAPAPAPAGPPEDKYKKKLRLLREGRDAGDIDAEVYITLVREVYDEQAAA